MRESSYEGRKPAWESLHPMVREEWRGKFDAFDAALDRLGLRIAEDAEADKPHGPAVSPTPLSANELRGRAEQHRHLAGLSCTDAAYRRHKKKADEYTALAARLEADQAKEASECQ